MRSWSPSTKPALHDLDELTQRQPELVARLYRDIAMYLSQRLRSTADAWHASQR